MSMTRATFLLLLLTTRAGASLTDQINQHAVTVLSAVSHPYLAPGVADRAQYVLQLELYDSEPNEIYDEDEWFDDNGLPYPEPPVKLDETTIPLQTKYGHLYVLRKTEKWAVAVYRIACLIDRISQSCDAEFMYTLVILENTVPVKVHAVYNLSYFYPTILELCWLEASGDYVYFNAAYNDFAELTEGNTGYLYCLDISTGTIVWATRNLVSSYYGFTVYGDYILTGYGFTNEDDFLYVIDRFTGEIVQTIPIKTAHEYILVKGAFCFVRTYNTNYIYKIIQKTQD